MISAVELVGPYLELLVLVEEIKICESRVLRPSGRDPGIAVGIIEYGLRKVSGRVVGAIWKLSKLMDLIVGCSVVYPDARTVTILAEPMVTVEGCECCG